MEYGIREREDRDICVRSARLQVSVFLVLMLLRRVTYCLHSTLSFKHHIPRLLLPTIPHRQLGNSLGYCSPSEGMAFLQPAVDVVP